MARLRVHALSTGEQVSSARFRVRQYIPRLRAHGVDVMERPSPVPLWAGEPPGPLGRYRWPRRAYRVLFSARSAVARIPAVLESSRASLVWLQKELVPGMVTFEPLLRRPYIFDVDDAVWMQPPFGRTAAAIVARHARVVVAGNAFLAGWFGRHAPRVEILPTPVDTEEFVPRPFDHPASSAFVIGWIGSRSALPALESIEGALAEYLAIDGHAELRVISSHAPSLRRIPRHRWRFVAWSPTVGPEEVRRMDVGLMPLIDTPQSHGKCGLKMLQYMSSAVPVVVSPLGINREVIETHRPGFGATTREEWVRALRALRASRTLRREMGARGRRAVEVEFSLSRCTRRLAQIMRSAATSSSRCSRPARRPRAPTTCAEDETG